MSERSEFYQRNERHIILREMGEDGVMRLAQSRVLVVGAGGLGSPVIQYLAAAGVGEMGIVDDDRVALSNLQRQVVHAHCDLHELKAESAARKAKAINPTMIVTPYAERFDERNGEGLIGGYDLVVDCTDSYQSKFFINDLCVAHSKPFVHGSILRFAGQVMTYLPGHACYRCLYDELPDDVKGAAEVGVFGPAVGVIGSMQAVEVLKVLAGVGEPLTDALLVYDALDASVRKISFLHRRDCPAHRATSLKSIETLK